MAVFVIVTFFNDTCVDFLSLIPDKIFREVIRLILAIPYCVIIISVIFHILNPNNTKKIYYCYFHLLYVLLPATLIGQYIYSGNVWKIITSLITSLIMACCIYKNLKQTQEADLECLKHSRLSVLEITTVIFTLLSLSNGEFKIIHYFFFYCPLLMLQVVYIMIDLERKGIKHDVAKDEHSTVIDPEEKEQLADSKEQGNTKVSGTICVNLKIEI